jgi:hypothetical protein
MTFINSLISQVATVRGTWDGSTLSATWARLGQHDDGGVDDCANPRTPPRMA